MQPSEFPESKIDSSTKIQNPFPALSLHHSFEKMSAPAQHVSPAFPLPCVRVADALRYGYEKLWLRCETKEFEHRAALTPTTAKQLMDAGFIITVEEDAQRIFAIEEYQKCFPPPFPRYGSSR